MQFLTQNEHKAELWECWSVFQWAFKVVSRVEIMDLGVLIKAQVFQFIKTQEVHGLVDPSSSQLDFHM